MKTWDVFLSHNSEDKPVVRELALKLKERGLRVWLDEWELIPGRPWQEALEVMVEQASTVAVLVGSEGIGPWQIAETRAFLAEFVNRGSPVIPVLLPGAPSRVDLPIFLRAFTWVDFRDGISSDALELLAWGITGSRGITRSRLTEADGAAPHEESNYKPRTVALKLDDVFRTVGLPRYTYVEPTIYRRFAHALETPGKHVVLEGPAGVGKTCMVYRALQELGYSPDADYEYISARDQQGTDLIISLCNVKAVALDQKLIVVDDVHLLHHVVRSQLANRLKVLSDAVFLDTSPTKFVLVGIPTASAALLFDAIDLGPRLSTYRLGRATDRQLHQLLEDGQERLSVRFRDPEIIVTEASGSFHLCQHICHEVCFNEGILETQVDVKVLRFRLNDIRRVLLDELQDRFGQQVLAFCRGREWKLNDVSGFMAILASLSRREKSVVSLNELLVDAGPYAGLVRTAVEALVNPGDESASSVLGRLLHYDSVIETFAIEDPVFRYYLSHLDIRSVLSDLGIANLDFAHYYTGPTGSRSKAEDAAAQVGEEMPRDSVFISYSHADSEWMQRLRLQLAPLVGDGVVSFWSDAQIRAGADWLAEIDEALDAARVAIMLVSASYLASPFIASKELPALLERAKSRRLRIIWVPISPCAWRRTPIASYQCVINPEKTLVELPWPKQEHALMTIGERIMDELSREMTEHEVLVPLIPLESAAHPSTANLPPQLNRGTADNDYSTGGPPQLK